MDPEEKNEAVLYHYCSVDALKKILESRTVRFSDVMKSNDSEEVKWLWGKYYRQMRCQSENQASVALLKHSIEQQLEQTSFLTFCLSRRKNALHMWNCYGNRGVNIGFYKSELQNWAKRICMHVDSEYPNQATIAEMREVEYYKTSQINAYCKIICEGAEFTVQGYGDIFFKAPFLKNVFFGVEQEERILITVHMASPYMANTIDYVDPNGTKLADVKFESVSNRNFDNVMACHVPFEASMIHSITLGPNCSLSKSDITQLLFIYGIDVNVEVKKARGSFR